MQELPATSSLPSEQKHLPQELIDYIIGYLHGDRDTLLSCSRVSRSWLPSAQAHLFHSVTIGPGQELQQFISFITVSPYLCRHIVRISVDGRSPANPLSPTPIIPYELSEMPQLQELNPVQIQTFISLFPCLQAIELKYVHLVPTTEAAISRQKIGETRAKFRLERFLVGHCSFEHPTDLLEFVQFFQGINHLYIAQNFSKSPQPRRPGQCPEPMPTISHLSFEYLRATTRLHRASNLASRSILQALNTKPLQSLQFTHCPPWAFRYASLAIEAVDPGLPHLSLDLKGLSERFSPC